MKNKIKRITKNDAIAYLMVFIEKIKLNVGDECVSKLVDNILVKPYTFKAKASVHDEKHDATLMVSFKHGKFNDDVLMHHHYNLKNGLRCIREYTIRHTIKDEQVIGVETAVISHNKIDLCVITSNELLLTEAGKKIVEEYNLHEDPTTWKKSEIKKIK